MDSPNHSSPARILGQVAQFLAVLGTCVYLYLLLGQNYANSAVRGPNAACKTQQRKLAAALDEYADRHGGVYPASLAELPVVVRCPRNLQVDYGYRLEGRHFRLSCSADHQRWATFRVPAYRPGFPQYDSITGVLYEEEPWSPSPTPSP